VMPSLAMLSMVLPPHFDAKKPSPCGDGAMPWFHPALFLYKKTRPALSLPCAAGRRVVFARAARAACSICRALCRAGKRGTLPRRSDGLGKEYYKNEKMSRRLAALPAPTDGKPSGAGQGRRQPAARG